MIIKINKMEIKKEIEIKFKIAEILAKTEVNLLDQSKKLTDIYNVFEQQFSLQGVSQRSELLKAFVEFTNRKDTTNHTYPHLINDFLDSL
jgi:hypothetical protein